MKKEMITGHYIGKDYSIYSINVDSHKILSVQMNEENFSSIFDNGFKSGDIQVKLETNSENYTPIEFKGVISKISKGYYEVRGYLKEYLHGKKDFDFKEEFVEYLENGPDKEYDFDLLFTGEDLQETLNEHLQVKNSHEYQTTGAIIYGIFTLARSRVKDK